MSNAIPPDGAGKLDVTVNENVDVPLFPSSNETSLTLNFGTSSVMIVASPCASLTLAPETLVTLTKKVSVGSKSTSPFTATSNVYVCDPAGIVCPVNECAT